MTLELVKKRSAALPCKGNSMDLAWKCADILHSVGAPFKALLGQRWTRTYTGCRSGSWRHSARLLSYPAQSFLSVFRSLAMVEKSVEKCCISLSGSNSHLVVQLHCKYGEQAAGQFPPWVWGKGRLSSPLTPFLLSQGSRKHTTSPSRTVSPYKLSSTQPCAPTCSVPQHGEYALLQASSLGLLSVILGMRRFH